MYLDHIAYRVADRNKAAKFFKEAFEYVIAEEFTINFDDGSEAKCIAMKSYDSSSTSPDIFVSDGTPDSIVGRWVKERGGVGGVHHMAYGVFDVQRTMTEWEAKGFATFQTKVPLTCPGLTQVFTHPHPLTGIIYELIRRDAGNAGFCKDNVKQLMINSDNK